MNSFSARWASATEEKNWDKHVEKNPGGGNWLHSEAFAEVKQRWGWNTRRIVCEGQEYNSYIFALEKHVPLFGKLWYLIQGPAAADVKDLPFMMRAMKSFFTEQDLNVFMVKIEPALVYSDENDRILNDAGFKKTFDIQPNDHTVSLNTQIPVNKLFGRIGSRARNSIKRAEKAGVIVKQAELTPENLRTMYQLMGTVQQGKSNFTLRPFPYYEQFWKAFAAKGQGRLYFVYEDDEPSVGAYVINYGKHGVYKDGGSRPARKQSGDAHLLQWRAIQDLKNEWDIVDYDFCGTPPSNKAKDKSESFYGMALFKTSFEKKVIDYMGCYDYPVNALKHEAWEKIGEKIVRRLYVRKHRSAFY